MTALGSADRIRVIADGLERYVKRLPADEPARQKLRNLLRDLQSEVSRLKSQIRAESV